jgi:NADPH:quinone reductase-like Zn-dependent oxidoreductase
MTTTFPPATIRTWQYHSTRGGLEKNLTLNTSNPLPKPNSNQHLVQILAVCLNPVDYKPAEIPIANRIMISRPATPGIDIAGCIVTPASGSPLKRGDLVFGCPSNTPLAGGALTEFAVCEKGNVVAVPEGVSAIDASTVCVAGLTAYQTIVPRVKKGDKVLINGGSGGVGVFGIQIAKVVGCHVTATCSTANIELCKSLGAETGSCVHGSWWNAFVWLCH